MVVQAGVKVSIWESIEKPPPYKGKGRRKRKNEEHDGKAYDLILLSLAVCYSPTS